jgi:chromate reductase, NAD(P)H dehydrogenase (quinone)
MILALSGSLRRTSVNGAALRAAAAAAAARSGITVTIADVVRELPHFDPDLEHTPPDVVLRFRTACENAAGVLLSVPEYAFGIPGAFKNALDWTVGAGSLYRKPITVLDVAPPGRGGSVRRALDLVLKALDADVVHRSVPISQADRNASGEITSPEITEELYAIVSDLAGRAAGVAAA